MADDNINSLYSELLAQCQDAWLLGKPAEALECLAIAQSLVPEHFEAIAWSAVLAELQGDQEQCIQSITKLAELIGEEPAAELFAERLTLLSTRQNSTHSFLAAFLELDITPKDFRVELQGYATAQKRIAQDVLSPLKLQALMLEDAKGSRALMISADLFAFDPKIVADIRKYAGLWQIPDTAVLLNASHTHYAPPTLQRALPSLGQYSKAYAEFVVNQIIRALPKLRQQLRPASIELGQGQASVGVFRRVHKDGQLLAGVLANQDPKLSYNQLGLAKVTWQESSQSLILVNYGCHPTEYGACPVISSAYPGLLRNALKQQQNLSGVMFLQGAAGDHKVAINDGEERRWPNTIQEAKDAVVPLITAVNQTLAQPLKPITGYIQSAQANLIAELNIDHIKSKEQERASLDQLNQERDQVFAKYPKFKQDTLELNLGFLQIGQWKLNAFNGEAVSDYARWCHTELDPLAFVLSYTNGNIAYIPSDQMIKEGGYEGESSQAVYLHAGPFKLGLEQKIKNVFSEVWQQLAQSTAKTKVSSQQLDQQSKHRAFFVLSTGRSGTQTLAHLMEMAQNAVVWHHPEPNMIMETLHAYQNIISVGDTFWRGRSHILAHAWEQGKIHGETDHNMTPFAAEIAKDIPNSKFLVLVRDPREFIRSGMRRGYYIAGGPWDDGRLKPLPKQAKKLNWPKMHPFEKVCWLWAETYRHINQAIEKIGQDRVMIVKFEDLIKGPKLAEDIFSFLELEGYQAQQAQQVLSQKLNAQRGGDFPHPRDWEQKLHDAAWHYCGEIAKGYGYPKVYGG